MFHNLNEIQQEIRRLKEIESEFIARDIAIVIQEIKQKMKAYGITVDDLIETKVTRKPVAVRFRNPETGDEWAGRGRTPKWLVKIESSGGSRDDFRV